MDQRVRHTLTLIFKLLDKDNNGKISSNEIHLNLVPTDILVILKPLLIELEAYDEELDQEEFVESALVLFNSLDINSKNIVLSIGKKVSRCKSELGEQNKFKPEISKRSKKLAEEARARRDPAIPVE